MKKGHLIGLLLALVMLLIGTVLYLLMTREQGTAPALPPVTNLDINTTSPAATTNNNQNKDTLTYNNSLFAFQYPLILKVNDQGETVDLTHSVAYAHPDLCELRDGVKNLDAITDFDVSFALLSENLKTAVKEIVPESIFSDYFKGDTVVVTPGYIDDFNAGSLKGYRITNGNEGCGEYAYYFPIGKNSTLMVKRNFVPEFQPINANYKAYLKIPGIVPPEQEEKYFDSILSSFKIK